MVPVTEVTAMDLSFEPVAMRNAEGDVDEDLSTSMLKIPDLLWMLGALKSSMGWEFWSLLRFQRRRMPSLAVVRR